MAELLSITISLFLFASPAEPFLLSPTIAITENRWMRRRTIDLPSLNPTQCQLATHPQHSQQESSSAASSQRRRSTKRNGRSKRKPPRKVILEDAVMQQTWRVFGVEVHPDRLALAEKEMASQTADEMSPDKKFLNDAVLDALYARLRLRPLEEQSRPPPFEIWPSHVRPPQRPVEDVRVVRRSLDARPRRHRADGDEGPRYIYVLDVDVEGSGTAGCGWKHQPGRMELLRTTEESSAVRGTSQPTEEEPFDQSSSEVDAMDGEDRPRRVVIVVGAGPAGLFCALQLARAGMTPIVLERGQPVESRGKDIGALMHRRSLDSESNFAFGEGGAGTWSDGKLTTRIGRNSDAVRHVLTTFVEYGAPENILVEGAPHLGTDNLVRLLRNMRRDLRRLGGEIRFGTKVTQLLIENGVAKGVEYVSKPAVERSIGDDVPFVFKDDESGTLHGDAIVLATGHSARDVYEKLYDAGVQLEAKGFAVGFRVEHPQKLINKIQYGSDWGATVFTGRKPTDTANQEYFDSTVVEEETRHHHHEGKLPVPSYRLATDEAFDGKQNRGVYSFCMCPGGQIVPASTDPEEVCVNGMSFSRRDSLWANSALVVTVAKDDCVLDPYRSQHGVLAGVAFQRDMERRASIMGGGNLTVPVQRLTDFIAGVPSTSAPSSSYRLGIKPCACHEIYPPPLIQAIRHALTEYFERRMPGFVCEEGLLHGVETRTSSPVRITRDEETLQAIGAQRLFPAGEGAGFAGGIVSAAVDGMVVASAVMDTLSGHDSREKSDTRDRIKSVGFSY